MGSRQTEGAVCRAHGEQHGQVQVEFDFDSEPDDIAAGATAIAADFIQGSPPQVTGQILDAGGALVVEATVTCQIN